MEKEKRTINLKTVVIRFFSAIREMDELSSFSNFPSLLFGQSRVFSPLFYSGKNFAALDSARLNPFYSPHSKRRRRRKQSKSLLSNLESPIPHHSTILFPFLRGKLWYFHARKRDFWPLESGIFPGKSMWEKKICQGYKNPPFFLSLSI